MYVKYVASNLKGGVSAVLGKHTVLCGPNGTGKSAVIAALELALVGRVSDIAGRDSMAKETDLIAHLAPGGKGELFARAVFDDQTEASWLAGAKGSKRAKHTVPDAVDVERVLPLMSVTDAVLGNPLTARKFFMGFIMPHLTLEALTGPHGRIPEDLRGHFREACLKSHINDAPIDKLLIALEYAESKSRGASSKAKAQKETVVAIADGLEPLPSAEIVEAVKVEQKAARKNLEAIVQQRASTQQLEKMKGDAAPIHEKLQAARENVALLKGSLAQMDAALAATPQAQPISDYLQRMISLLEELAAAEVNGGVSSCPLCKQHSPSPSFFRERAQAARAYVAGEQAKAAPYAAAINARNECAEKLQAWQNHVAQLETQLTGVQQMLAVATPTTGITDAELAAAQERVTRADAEMMRLEALKARWSDAERVKDQARSTSKEGDLWVDLRDACAEAISDLLDSNVASFNARVQAHLPATDRFELHLRDGRKPIFRVGLRRGDSFHTALSGAEWARVMAAMAAACITPGKLAVVIPPDRSFDPQTLSAVLAAFDEIDGQVIVATANPPATIPAGWTVIDTATGAHRNGQV